MIDASTLDNDTRELWISETVDDMLCMLRGGRTLTASNDRFRTLAARYAINADDRRARLEIIHRAYSRALIITADDNDPHTAAYYRAHEVLNAR